MTDPGSSSEVALKWSDSKYNLKTDRQRKIYIIGLNVDYENKKNQDVTEECVQSQFPLSVVNRLLGKARLSGIQERIFI